MKQTPKTHRLAALAIWLAVVFFGMANPAFAQAEPATPASDIAITNLWAINSMPAPNGLVDLTVFYGNLGPSENAVAVELKVDYDENSLFDVSLGDAGNCTDDKSAVTCHFNTVIPGEANTVGFTARVQPTAAPDTIVPFVATIRSDTLENDLKNDFSTLSVTVTSIEKGGRLTAEGIPANLDSGTLDTAATKGSVWLFDVSKNPNWKTDALSTLGLKFTIRGKEALAWTLNITDSGFRNPAISSNALKVLTVVNGLFILGLLAIAAMWMFSLFIPRHYLRQVIVIYGMAVLFVNFALPFNQLLVDASNILQRTFIGSTNISDIVEMPTYTDPKTIGYSNETGVLKNAASRKISLNLGTPEQQATKDIVVGKLQQPSISTPSLFGAFTTTDSAGRKQDQTISLTPTGNDPAIHLNPSQSVELVDEQAFNPNEEHRLFAFLLLTLTGVAYFGMALVFVVRIVLLWALMIVSPMLFVLAIFRSTRGYFFNWLSLYARWLLIGPLMALGIAIVVGIWKTVGMPISSAYSGFGQFGQLSNIGFYLPGASVVNNLSTTPQMMEYVLFLTMLYLPIFFAFMLTRQRHWGSSAAAIPEIRETERAPMITPGATPATPVRTPTPVERAKELTSGLTGFLKTGFAQTTKTAVPATLRATESRGPTLMPGSTALPEQLALTPLRDMLGLAAGKASATRNMHGKAIEKLASAEQMPPSSERQTLMSVRHEIEERASHDDPEATRILTEIHEKENATIGNTMGDRISDRIGETAGFQTQATLEPKVTIETQKDKAKPTETAQTDKAKNAETLADEEDKETLETIEGMEKQAKKKPTRGRSTKKENE